MLVHCHDDRAIRDEQFSLGWVDKHELAVVEERECDTKRNVDDTQWQRVSVHTSQAPHTTLTGSINTSYTVTSYESRTS